MINKGIMKLYELLKIDREKCFLLYPYQDEREKIKKSELQKYGNLDSYNIAMKYEAALMGLLMQERKEIIKTFNKLKELLVAIDIIDYNYNSTALVLAPYYDANKLIQYSLEIYKLFLFYKKPTHHWITTLISNPHIVIEGKNKLLYDDSLLNNLQLFPRFGLQCETNIKYLQETQTINAAMDALKAEMNLWDNTNNSSGRL